MLGLVLRDCGFWWVTAVFGLLGSNNKPYPARELHLVKQLVSTSSFFEILDKAGLLQVFKLPSPRTWIISCSPVLGLSDYSFFERGVNNPSRFASVSPKLPCLIQSQRQSPGCSSCDRIKARDIIRYPRRCG